MPFAPDLRAVANALGGEVVGSQVLAPGPGHSAKDRSLCVRLSATAPDGFLAFSHAGDDFRTCRDHIRARLGIEREQGRPAAWPASPTKHADETNSRSALALWAASREARGSIVETYLASRALSLDGSAAQSIRFNERLGAMISLFRNVRTGEPQAISRTYLDAQARKIDRKFLGPVGGAAIMLDVFEEVTQGLHIGEGVETCLAARQLGLRPTWALGSAGAIASFPILNGIEALTVLAENDDASARASEACADRWDRAGRIVLITRPSRGKDLNDAIQRRIA